MKDNHTLTTDAQSTLLDKPLASHENEKINFNALKSKSHYKIVEKKPI